MRARHKTSSRERARQGLGLNWAEAGSLGTKVGISGFFRKSRDILEAYLGFLQNYSWQQCTTGESAPNIF